ncbi:MAG TPA: hypothetical protein VFB22_00490 [Candidatus Baltobacteraceae bacterium]|nr:hypothetical protein [Candidatus Baltobacteraceae bacterium]
MDGRVLLVEFNELSPTLLERFMREGALPNFARLYASSDVFVTEAGEDGGTLVPWIQWPSVHTGVPYVEHGLFHLGEADRGRQPTIGSALAAEGIRIGLFGAMNVPAPERFEGFRLPDPWDKAGVAVPASLQPYYEATAEQVKESSHHGRLTARDALRLGTYYAAHAFNPRTAWAILAQLAAERLDRGVRWRRAALFDHIQYDVFLACVKAHGVRFASFFSNSTAHYQHLYWRNMEPQAFPDPPDASAHPSLREAVLHGYRTMDALVGRMLRDFADATIVFATALSQEPYTGPVLRNYRPVDFQRLLTFLGIEGARVAPVMTHEFHVDLSDAASAERAQIALAALHVDGERVLEVRREGNGVFCGCRYFDPAVLEAMAVDARTGAQRPFSELFYLIDGFRSGHHHPEGALWIRTSGEGRVHPERVSILDIAPTILSRFGVAAPATMRGRVLPLGAQPAPERTLTPA